MVLGACLGLTACEDIKKLEITVSVYDADESAVVDKTLTVDLYRHLAPETVDHIINECVNKGYYNDAIFYKFADTQTNPVMMGDLLYKDGAVKQNDSVQVPTVKKGEFTNGGTIGSNLLHKEGSVSLWRTWMAQDGSYNTNGSVKTGRGTWMMPTSSIIGYDDWFCVFAQINLEDQTNSDTWNAIKSIFSDSENYDEYVIYYTGEYDANGSLLNNHGLIFNCVEETAFEELELEEGDYFSAEGGEFVCYNKTTVKIPFVTVNNTVQLGAKIKSVKLI
jgi:cyclophilin family peptidyl-prolyl cis-trans isomerase